MTFHYGKAVQGSDEAETALPAASALMAILGVLPEKFKENLLTLLIQYAIMVSLSW